MSKTSPTGGLQDILLITTQYCHIDRGCLVDERGERGLSCVYQCTSSPRPDLARRCSSVYEAIYEALSTHTRVFLKTMLFLCVLAQTAFKVIENGPFRSPCRLLFSVYRFLETLQKSMFTSSMGLICVCIIYTWEFG